MSGLDISVLWAPSLSVKVISTPGITLKGLKIQLSVTGNSKRGGPGTPLIFIDNNIICKTKKILTNVWLHWDSGIHITTIDHVLLWTKIARSINRLLHAV